MVGFTMIDFAILVVYLLAVLLAGLHFSKKEMKGKEFIFFILKSFFLIRVQGEEIIVRIPQGSQQRPCPL